MIRSAWRGEARIASAPNRARSFRGEPTTAIISIAQQASPKVIGKHEFARAQLRRSSSRPVNTDRGDVVLEIGVDDVPSQHVAGAKLADPEVLRRVGLGKRRERPQLLAADYFHSSAPRRQT